MKTLLLHRLVLLGGLLLVGATFAQESSPDGNEVAASKFVANPKTRALLDQSQRYVEEDSMGRKHLVGGHKHVLLARVGSDGQVEMFCADNVHSAEKWANSAPKTERQR